MPQSSTRHSLKYISALFLSIGLLSGCAINMKVPIKEPVPSAVRFEQSATTNATALYFNDGRNTVDKGKLLTGLIPMNLQFQDQPFDAVPWVAINTVKELQARGLPVKLGATATDATAITIQRLNINNHRASGFSPFVTFTYAQAEVSTANGPKRITAYVKRGKVPVWSFDEIIDPTYNDALSLITKELAAKINQELFAKSISDQQVADLVAAIEKDSTTRTDAYLDVYQLGFGNNPKAVPALVKMASHSAEYVRLAAISSLGTLKAQDQYSFLVNLHESQSGLWQDRAMALKAIGDLGTEQSRNYLQSLWKSIEKSTDKESAWNKDVISLYL